MTNNSNATLFITDVCGTLVYDDTTLGLLRVHFSQQPERQWRLPMLRALTAHFSPFRLGIAVIERLTGKHVLKHLLVRMMVNDTVSSLELNAEVYAQWLLDNRKVPAVWDVITPAIKDKRIILASASLQPIISALAKQLGVRFVASELESNDGVLTGRYRSDLTGLKIQALSDLIGNDLSSSFYDAISDNVTDQELLSGAKRAYVVLHKASHKERWAGLNATYIGLNP
ncbi:haloacid dehalogenase-like hydrolase [Psychrobacter immobilis]|uniref:haloacid dehalogenase-like hydrolase n=1 Tax=Psychrobacter immobilis TaxID=498 RepID=UPI00191AFC6A|nr:haloacid dehalogenase-like hydrolase [Psychrobacter immobilis]